jgi:putative transposase
MRRFKKSTLTIFEYNYHIVFCPKYRFKIFKDEIGEYARRELCQLCRQKELIEVLGLNIQPDHVHLILSVLPKYSISSVVGYLKGKLALKIFERYERLGRRHCTGAGIYGREATV